MSQWERFWFRVVPSDSFSLLRILFGFTGLAELLTLLPVSTFWPLSGLVPITDIGTPLRAIAESMGLGTVGGWGLFLFQLVSLTCMTLGIFTSPAIACSFAGSVLHSFWNALPLSGAHDVLTVMLFCLLWADCGGSPSVDSWLQSRRGKQIDDPAQPILPLRLIRGQVVLIYMNSALWKLFGATWRDGSTVHYVLNLNTFQRFPGATPVSIEPLLTLATYGTLFWEMSFGFLMFNRWTRRAALTAGVLIHLGLWATLELGVFSLMMLSSYVAFADPEWLSRVMRSRLPLIARRGAGLRKSSA